MSMDIRVTKDTASMLLADLVRQTRPSRLGKLLGRAAANVVKRHLEMLPPNKKGWPTTDFWKEASRSTSSDGTPDGAVVTISKQGFRQRLLGGPINPKPGKRLAIPARAEAYGKRAGEFTNLRIGVGIAEDGWVGFGLVDTPRTDIRIGKRGVRGTQTHLGIRLFYYFSRGLKQKADPSVLPHKADLLDAAAMEIAATLPPS